MCRVLAAPLAVFGKLQLVWRRPLVLGRRVIALLAVLALERDDDSIRCHGRPCLSLDDLGDHARAHRAPTLADGEAQTLLACDRRDHPDVPVRVVPRPPT